MSDHQAAEIYVKGLIKSVNAKDEQQFRKLMSKTVRNKYNSTDIQNLFNFFSATINEPAYNFVMSSGADFYGMGRMKENCESDITLEDSNGNKYFLLFSLINIDDFDTQNIGFTDIYVIDQQLEEYLTSTHEPWTIWQRSPEKCIRTLRYDEL